MRSLPRVSLPSPPRGSTLARVLDQVVAAISPTAGVRRAAARARLEVAGRLYEAGAAHHQHTAPLQGDLSGDGVVDAARGGIRAWARNLDENFDLAGGVLDELVEATLGSHLDWLPQTATAGGQPHKPTNDQIRAAWMDFWERPEVTGEYTGAGVERLVARAWLRDGEVLTHHVEGRVRGFSHSSAVPYSIELIEADMLPWDLFDDSVPAGRVVHGVEKDRFGRPVAYHLYRGHPGDYLYAPTVTFGETRRVPAAELLHLKLVRRIGQTRGVSVLANVIFRLDDIRQIDVSERMAVRIASALGAVITKHPDVDTGTPTVHDDTGERGWQFQPGMVIDSLMPGEDVKVIGSDRPNPELIEYRADQIRAVAAGTGAKYSSISKRYDGSYSAQRQELVESEPGYEQLRGAFREGWARPIYRRWLRMAIASGVVRIPSRVDPRTVFDVAIQRSGGVPWIDPKKEIEADALAVQAGFLSRAAVIRRRGMDPDQVDAERAADAMPGTSGTPGTPGQAPEDDEEEAA